MKKLSAFALLNLAMAILHPQPMMGSPSAADSLVYYLPFDETTKAAKWVGGQPGPVAERGLTFVPGICGKAVYVGGHGNEDYAAAPLLEYEAGTLFASPSGTVSFWVRPDWDGSFEDPQNFPWYFLLNVMGGKATPDFDSLDLANDHPYGRFTLFMWNWLRGDVAQKGGKPQVMLEWRCRASWMRNDWWHVAFTWNEKKQVRLYVNGLSRSGEAEPMLADSQRFFIGCGPRTWTKNSRANAAFDEFKIFNRALNGPEIRDEFRRLAPVDFSVERRYLRANTPEQIMIEVEPGAGAATPVTGGLQLRIVADADGKTVAEKKTNLKLTRREDITMPVSALSTGNYRLECVLGSGAGCYQRSYALTVYQQENTPVVSKDPVKLGERIASIDCTKGGEGFFEHGASQVREVAHVGNYREAGENKADRYAFEIKIPNADGSPVMMEITWPDDHERSMGLYMIPRAESVQDRDRLGGGIQSGGEYPVSGAMQKASYLFYPSESRYLFEVRTMVQGLPAAVGKVEFFRIAERLPKLPITSPDGLPGRLLGHLDEDQSFEVLIAPRADSRFPKSPFRGGYPIQALERLMDYFDYTGQNVMSYSLARYDWTHYDEGPINSPGSALLPPGGVMLMLDMFERRNQHLIGNINLYGTPVKPATFGLGVELTETLEKRVQEGYFLLDRNGKPQMPPSGWNAALGNNPLHPVIRARLLQVVDELLRRYGKHPAFQGIDIWCSRERCPFVFNSLDYGYDDMTVGLFEKETGITVPNMDKATARFDRRYQYLTKERREEWIRWRSRKTTEMFREIDQMVRATRPDLKLFLSPTDWLNYMSPGDLAKPQCERFDFATFSREQLSMDLEALKQLPSVILNPQPNVTAYRWVKHWHGRESVFRELNANIEKFQVFRNGPRSAFSLYLSYFESFCESLKQDTYKAYFQNADAKAHGRFFLEDLARGMAAVDPSILTVGAQPLGSAGRDLEVREFAQAFRALPAGAYRDVDGLKDPVTVRQFQTSKGTYFYAVNLIWMPVSVTLKFENEKVAVADLSGGQPLNANGGEVTVGLKPFEMRALLVSGSTGRSNVTGRMIVPEETRRWYFQRVKELEKDVQAIAENGGEVDPQKERLETIKNLMARDAYAEIHRLLFSKMIRELGEYKEYSAAGFYKDMKAMLARSQYAISCGNGKFYRAKSGQLFLPDNHYEPGGYGYEGNYLSIERSITGLKGSDDPTLFAAEAYNLDAYRFTVKNGMYLVRMYFKVGYKPRAKPGEFVFNLDIENKRVLSEFDVFEAVGRDFDRVVMREFKDIEVKDGVLDIEFGMPASVVTDSTVKMCNAIEVIPQPSTGTAGGAGR